MVPFRTAEKPAIKAELQAFDEHGCVVIHEPDRSLSQCTLGAKIKGDNLAEAPRSSLQESSLDERKLACITTDNIVAAVRKLGWQRLSCFGHNLHLAVTNALKTEKDRTARAGGLCRTLVTTFSQSWQKKRKCRKNKLNSTCPAMLSSGRHGVDAQPENKNDRSPGATQRLLAKASFVDPRYKDINPVDHVKDTLLEEMLAVPEERHHDGDGALRASTAGEGEGAVFSVRFVYHDIMDSRRFSVEDPTSSCRVRRDEQCHAFISSLTQHSLFRAFILMIIIVNSFVIALEEEYNNPGLFREAEWIFLILYVLEFSMRVYVEPRSFWRSGFNIFSSALLLLSLVAVFAEGATSFFSLQNFRPFRALRVLKIISFFPSLQVRLWFVVLAKAIKRAVYVMCLVVFIMYIFAVAGVLYFGEQATGDTEHWGDLGSALLTVFGLITLDSWVDLLRKVDGLGVAYSRLFPIIFILIGHFIFFNMFVGLVIMEVERMTKAREEEALQEREAAKKGAKKKRTMKQLIGSQVSKLKKWSDTNIKTDENFPRIIQQLRMSLSDSDHIVTKDKSSSLTFLQIYLTTLQHQDTTLDRLQQIYDEMLEVLGELLELQQEEQREEEEHEGDAQ
ncbi:hypothetical protein SRHO_G00028860 [Serrasalmus rhombeus]